MLRKIIIPSIIVAACQLVLGCETSGNGRTGTSGQSGIQFGEAFSNIGDAIVTAYGDAENWVTVKYGEWLGEEDQAGISGSSATAAETAHDAQTVNWSNSRTGTAARITPTNTRTERRNLTVVRDARVEPTSNLIVIGKTYEALRSSNVRAAPSTSAVIVNKLAAGSTFNAVGRVENANWILASRDNRSIGYVYGPLVRESASQKQAEMRTAVNLDDIELDENTVVDEVTVETSCRTLNYEVTSKDGERAVDTFEACKSADGAWEID